MSSATSPEERPAHSPEDTAATFCATLVDEWIQHGVCNAVIAPGSRSTPMALELTRRPELRVHVVHDERAASFVALGIGLNGVPAILLCTSGTAAAHFHGAVIEAHQSAVPMIVCTADRPPELRDVGAAQTIDQLKLYGDSVRWFHDPGVASDAASHTWRSLAAHCYAFATGLWPGPVHLNLPFREPLVGQARELPQRRAVAGRAVALSGTPGLNSQQLDEVAAMLQNARGVIVAGRGCGDPHAVAELARASGWPVIADARSGLRHVSDVAICAADQLLRVTSFAREHEPAVVVRLGEAPASKVLNQWLAKAAALQIHISLVPTWADPDAVVAHHIVAEPGELCRALASRVTFDDRAWMSSWLAAESAAQSAISESLSTDGKRVITEPQVARLIGALVPDGAHLVVSSSMPIRDVEWFGIINEGVTVHSNRGANGIDGVIATAIGVSIGTSQPTALLIGDVAFVHDSAALIGLMSRGVDLRIVVIDNDGGGIFSFLPQAESLAPERFEQLFGTPHGTDLIALAGAHSIPARSVVSLDELRAALDLPGPQVIRVSSVRHRNVAVHHDITDAVVRALEFRAE